MSVKVSITECRAGADPKIFDGEKGSKVARLDVAHNERVEGAGTVKDETRWFQAVAFGPAAKFIQDHVHKGSRLTIADAELHYGRAYTGKDGVERTPDELHIIPGRAKIELKEAAGERQDQKTEAKASGLRYRFVFHGGKLLAMDTSWYHSHCAGCEWPFTESAQRWWLKTHEDGTPLLYCLVCAWHGPMELPVQPPPDQACSSGAGGEGSSGTADGEGKAI